MKKKGQALVEFILILPIFLMLLLSTIDIGKIFYTKIILEDKMSDIIDYDLTNEEEIISKFKLEEDKIELKIVEDNEYLNYEIKKKVDIITPGLNLIFKNPYNLTVTRSIKNE